MTATEARIETRNWKFGIRNSRPMPRISSFDFRISSFEFRFSPAPSPQNLVLRCQLHAIARFQVPNLGGVLFDGAVRRELSGAGHVENSHAVPNFVVPI